ncbi:MAG: helix-turn-helix domain-containing protein [Slackia sp.]
MKKFSQDKFVNEILRLRKAKGLTQAQLAEQTSINRAMIGRIENSDYIPTIEQMESLASTLGFEPDEMFVDTKPAKESTTLPQRKIAVAGTGYVGLSLAVLLAQHNPVIAVDVVPEKVDLINERRSPIQDSYIEQYLAEKELNLTATLDGATAYKDADFVIIAAPTNYDSKTNFFDCSHVEEVIKLVMNVNPDATMVIKSTIPVGYTESIRKKFNTNKIIFSPEFLRESKALYDNLYPLVSSSPAIKNGKCRMNLRHYCSKALKDDIEFSSWASLKQKRSLFANTYLALRVSYFNELDTYAETKGLTQSDYRRSLS